MSHEMEIVAGRADGSSIALPEPRVAISIRPAVLSDIPFLDSLQKLHTKQVGWMPTAQFEGKIKLGHVLIAEESCGQHPERVGYVIGNDQYFKRDDVGIIYQLNVLPGKQRGFIGATLLKAMFDRAAYGCRLFCCWCAQDIEANYFWQSVGFVPLAFRAGSRTKGAGGQPRVHIFWQKRIRSGDTTTPWWFPSQTTSGAIREDRLVFPIPPGTTWQDAKPLILPGGEVRDLPHAGTLSSEVREEKQLPGPRAKRAKAIAKPVQPTTLRAFGGLRAAVPVELTMVVEKPKREPRKKQKNDPRLVAAARELRDRWLEQLNASPVLPQGRYDVRRQLQVREESPVALPKCLPAAA